MHVCVRVCVCVCVCVVGDKTEEWESGKINRGIEKLKYLMGRGVNREVK